jgi:hypothetical protein
LWVKKSDKQSLSINQLIISRSDWLLIDCIAIVNIHSLIESKEMKSQKKQIDFVTEEFAQEVQTYANFNHNGNFNKAVRALLRIGLDTKKEEAE